MFPSPQIGEERLLFAPDVTQELLTAFTCHL